MRFLSVEIEAFGPFAEPVQIPLAGQGLVLIDGVNHDAGDAAESNGAGKSMLCESILWALYGRMVRYGRRRLGAEEVCNPQRGLAQVAVTFERAGRQFKVVRSRTLRGAPRMVCLEATASGWTPLPGMGSGVEEATADVLRLLGFDYEAARTAIFLHGAGLTFAGSGFVEQLQTLESILRFDLLTAAQELARQRAEALAGEEARVKVEAAQAAGAREAAERAIAGLDRLDEQEEQERLRAALDDARRAALAWHAEAQGLAASEAEAHRAHEDLVQAQGAMEAARRRWGALMGASERCPICQRDLPAPMYQALLTAAHVEYEQARGQASAAQEAATRSARALERLREARREIAVAEQRVRQGEHALAALQQRIEQRLAVRAEEVARLQDAKRREAEAQERVAQLVQEQQPLRFWATAFGPDGLRAAVLQAAVPVLNHAAARYSDLLTDGALMVEFDPFRSSRNESILRLLQHPARTYSGCSQGERRRLAITVALSLRALARWRLSEPVNVGLWDEAFEGLDDAGLRRVLQVLQHDLEEQETVLVISHHQTFKALFPGARVLRVERRGGISRAVWS